MEQPKARVKGASNPTHRELAPGDILDARFKITELIYHGAVADVFKAEDLENDGRLVAVKVPPRAFEINTALFARFRREEEIGGKLDHPYVLKFIPIEKKTRPYIVSEFLDGVTLVSRLKSGEPLTEADTLHIGIQICEAVQHLHERGIIHRDLKPENIMLCRDGSIRLMDFGISLSQEGRRLTFIGFAAGTPHYMAPERIRRKPGDARTDLYGIGAILYHMATGKIAFEHEDVSVILDSRVTGDPESPRRFNAKMSLAIEEIILRAMARDPEERFMSAAEMKAALQNPERVTVTGRVDRLEPSTPWKRGLRKARYVAAWCLIPVVAQVIVFLMLWHHFAKK